MALMGQGSANQAEQKGTSVASPDAKSKKAEAMARFKANRAAKSKKQYESSLALRDELAKAGLLDKLTPASKEFVISLCRDPADKVRASGFGGGPSVFNQLYGASPKVGDSVTLQQAFDKVFKGMSTIDLLVKRWAEKGIIVEKVPNKEKVVLTAYTIKALPTA